MNLNLIHEYIEAVIKYANRVQGSSISEHVLAMNSTWAKLDPKDQAEAVRLCEIKRL